MHDQAKPSAQVPSASRYFTWLFFLGALVFALGAGLVGDVFFLRLATEALIFGGLALSVDLLLGDRKSVV